MGEKADAAVSVEAVENATKSIGEPKATGRLRILGKTCWWVEFGDMAAVEITASASCTEQQLLAQSRASQLSQTIRVSSHSTEPPDADPHVRWCGRGVTPPYPDFWGRWSMDWGEEWNTDL